MQCGKLADWLECLTGNDGGVGFEAQLLSTVLNLANSKAPLEVQPNQKLSMCTGHMRKRKLLEFGQRIKTVKVPVLV